ncbi:MAG: CapA family protein [Muribaculum sp.]|nr:CapA family protein [Muribaculum sp.]
MECLQTTLIPLLFITLETLLHGLQEAELVFVGDAMQHKAQIEVAHKRDGTYDYSECFDSISDYIKSADYAVVNLETPFGGRPYTGYPCFSSPESYADALVEAGFDLFLTANNHTLDKLDRGLVRTLDSLDAKNISHIGTYRNKAERDTVLPFIRNIGGFNIGFLNYTYGTNGIRLTTDAVVDYIDRSQIKADIDSTRAHGAELIVACVHWGEEYKLLPNASQRNLADFLVDNGVELVIGAHPHVIQPIELRTDSLNNNALVVYSLGNFISNMKTRDTRGGIAVKAKIKRDREGKAYVADASYRLLFTVPPVDGHNYRVMHAEQVDHPLWTGKSRAFTATAEQIFRKYNKNVRQDSITGTVTTTPTKLIFSAE